MPCKIDGCDHKVMYPVIQLCQMHYFRFLRTGSYEIVKKPRKPFLQNPAGYKTIYCEESPLSDSRGCVYEHRQVVYEKYGDNLPDCEICGKPTTWATCHIDHKDECVTNNAIENLRPVCSGCNTSRTERKTTKKYEIDGVSKSLTEWAKHPEVVVSRHQIARRLASGLSVKESVFGMNKTHKKRNAAKLHGEFFRSEVIS